MPILIMGLMALAVFLTMGFLLFSAVIAEKHDRDRRAAMAAHPPEEKNKAQAAHA